MAFSKGTARRAGRITQRDELILYLTRGAFDNPTRDRSQLAGVAIVTSPVRRLRKPGTIASREFVVACDIDVEVSFSEREGLPSEPLIRRKDLWGQYLEAGSRTPVIRG